jgi:tricorn protease-like protein
MKRFIIILLLSIFVIYVKQPWQEPRIIKADRIDVGTCDKVWHLVLSDGKEEFVELTDVLDWWEILPDGRWTNMGTK